MKVEGKVPFRVPAPTVYVYLARQALSHGVEEHEGATIDRNTMIVTRYHTKLGPFTVVTTEEATFDPGRSITWRHVDGPLTGSVEQFSIETTPTTVHYTGDVAPRNQLFKGPLAWLVAQLTKRVSLGALDDARRALEGDSWTEGGMEVP